MAWGIDTRASPALRVTEDKIKDNTQLFPFLLRMQRKWVYTPAEGFRLI